MTARSTASRGLRKAFTENLGLKIISLVAAIVLFSLVRGSEDAQRSLFVDVVATLPPPSSGKILTSEIPDKVKVTLRGSRSLLNSIRREDLGPVQMDLRDTSLRYYYFDPSRFDMPAGVRIEQLAPASIPLTWADRAEKKVPVTANLVGEPSDSYSVRRPVEISPPTITVRGPASEVDTLRQVQTEPIDVRGLAAGMHDQRVPLERPPPHSTFVDGVAVRVRFQIVPELAERQIHDLIVAQVGGASRATMRPMHVDVTLRGPPDAVDALDAERVVPFVDTSDVPPGGGAQSKQVQVRGVPTGITVEQVDPAEVLVTVPRGPRHPGTATP